MTFRELFHEVAGEWGQDEPDSVLDEYKLKCGVGWDEEVDEGVIAETRAGLMDALAKQAINEPAPLESLPVPVPRRSRGSLSVSSRVTQSGHDMITEQRLAEIEARHATDPIWQWFNRASNAYWGFAGRVAAYFPLALGRVRSNNPFVGIARLTFVFIAGFIIVPPLYFILGPLVQLGIVLITVIWTCLAGIFGWHRPSAAQLAGSIAAEQ
jgi:hypothetical protein